MSALYYFFCFLLGIAEGVPSPPQFCGHFIQILQVNIIKLTAELRGNGYPFSNPQQKTKEIAYLATRRNRSKYTIP